MLFSARTLAVLLASLLITPGLQAITFMDTGDPQHNTQAPGGELLQSGWSLQGKWGGFLGTAVAPHYFLTATHIGGAVGGIFYFRGVAYKTTARFDDPESDLTLWRVAGTLPEYASLYSGSDEPGKPLVVFGRGPSRQDEVVVGGLLGTERKGWKWSSYDGIMRWGQNKVTAIITGGANRQGKEFQLLRVEFNQNGGPNEAHLSDGDSGGGLFIQTSGGWKLAGVNHAVDGPYNTSASGAGFRASIYDEGGLYKGGEGNWSAVSNLPSNQAGSFYATRISPRLAWIESILALPLPEPIVALEFSSNPSTGFTTDLQAKVDPVRKEIHTPISHTKRFYRLSFETGLRIYGTRIEDGMIVLNYE